MSKLDLKIQGVRGGDPQWLENKGRCLSFIDNASSANYISVDAFEGWGEDYKRREECLITIQFNQSVWTGTIKDLAEALKIA